VTLLSPSANIAFSNEALKANLSRLEDEWETYQTTRDRDGIYQYLAAMFELIMWWKHEQKAVEYARRAFACAASSTGTKHRRTIRSRNLFHRRS
jgi:hypothetical protein